MANSYSSKESYDDNSDEDTSDAEDENGEEQKIHSQNGSMHLQKKLPYAII